MSLSLILHRLHERARLSAPAPVYHILSGGSKINLQIADGKTFISVSRPERPPRLVEFRTVLNHYPAHKPADVRPVIQQKRLEDGQYHIIASWVNSEPAYVQTLAPQLSLMT